MPIFVYTSRGPWWLPFAMLFGLPLLNGGLGVLFNVVLYLFGIDPFEEIQQPQQQGSASRAQQGPQSTQQSTQASDELTYDPVSIDVIRGIIFTLAGFLFFRVAMLLNRGVRIRLPGFLRRIADSFDEGRRAAHTQYGQHPRGRQAASRQPRVTVDQVVAALQKLPTEVHVTEEELHKMSVHELKELLQARGVDCSQFLEKRELLDQMQCGGSSAATCSICCEDFESGEPVRVLKCQHRFHIDCVDKWLLSSTDYTRPPACPLCNAELIPPANDRRSVDSPAASTA